MLARGGGDVKGREQRGSGPAEATARAPLLTVVVPATDRPFALEACLAAITRARDDGDEVIVVEEPTTAGPAEARNLGAASASGDVLVFVDADVLVRDDALERIRAAFAADPELAAVFGSYDDSPTAGGFVSSFRNLLHHWVHHSGAGPATTFWAGLGAVRLNVFFAAGGFDAHRFVRPSVEDIDLGMRLAAMGKRIVLDPQIQGTHLKSWTLWEMVRTDFASRGVPWIGLLVRHRSATTALNLGWKHRASTLSCVVCIGAAILRRRPLALGSAVSFIVLNRDFYVFLLRRRGAVEAVAGIGLHAIHHLTAAAAAVTGLVHAALEGARPR